MTKENTNPDQIQYKARPFYNLAAIRRDLNTLTVRCAHDAEMLAAIKETCEAAVKLGKARHTAEVAARAELARQAAVQAEKDAAAVVAAERAKAEADLVVAKQMQARAEAVLAAE
jgi:hypothetical protein